MHYYIIKCKWVQLSIGKIIHMTIIKNIKGSKMCLYLGASKNYSNYDRNKIAYVIFSGKVKNQPSRISLEMKII